MATYRQIAEHVKGRYGFVPKTCWIAHVKADHSLTTRVAPNRMSAARREYPCPTEKRAAIEDALRDLKMI